MSNPKPCCSRPCLVPGWVEGKYGHTCTNCHTFTPSDGGKRTKVQKKRRA